MNDKFWVVTVDMGYGHQRTSYPLRNFAYKGIISANNYKGIPRKDKKIWDKSRSFYEFVSRLKRIPLLGWLAFWLFDRFQRILSYYPKRDLSAPNIQLKQIFKMIKKGWGRHFVEKIKEKPLPLVTTFFIPAFMAEAHGYPGDIYCIICDADIARTWVSPNPSKSRIKYFAPTNWVAGRLKLYGVKEENIFLTGYPLPLENIGTEKMEILKKDLGYRLLNLDPQGIYARQYAPMVKEHFPEFPQKSDHPLTLMFAVGGAGTQKEIGAKIVKSLEKDIKSGRIRVILVAGMRKKVKEYFEEKTKGLPVRIIYREKIEEYFDEFNSALRKTDILWTKPSELSFYSSLGLPIIIAPPVGSQEHFNKRWLLSAGSGTLQEKPKYAHQWLFDLVKSSRFAEAAMDGFIENGKIGTLNIKKIVLKNGN